MPVNEVVSERKAMLAKLLAQENLTIEFRNVRTAQFYVQNRILVLPNFRQDLSPAVYNLFIGHEVGHALRTPKDAIDTNIPLHVHNLRNIVEDTRIERFIKEKYPGLKKDFAQGYKELFQNNFFGTKGKDINKLGFVDRLNIFYKCGIGVGIKFSPEEQVLIDEIPNLKSFKEVREFSDRILTFIKSRVDAEGDLPSMPEPSGLVLPPSGTGLPALSDDDLVDMPEDDGLSKPDEDDEDGEYEPPEHGGTQVSYKDESEPKDPQNDPLPEEEAITTTEASEEAMKKLIDWAKAEIVTMNIPTFHLDNIIVGYKEFTKLIGESFIGKETANVKCDEIYKLYKANNTNTVQYLIKEFNLKKNAFQTQKAQIHNTGQLESKRLARYKTSLDIFKKNTIVPGGQSHGLQLFIDWSGSMSSCIYDCIQQLFCITDFCRQQNIPFDAYSFCSDSKHGVMSRQASTYQTIAAGDMDLHNFHLVQLLSSKMTHNQYVTIQKQLLYMMSESAGNYSVRRHAMLAMDSTPLNNAIVAAMQIVPLFKKENNLQIVNTIFLTDGASDSTCTYFSGRDDDRNGAPYGCKLYIRDPVTKHVKNVPDQGVYPEGGYGVTKELLELLQIRTNANVIGFYLINANYQSLVERFKNPNNPKANQLQWNKEGYLVQYGIGYNEHYCVRRDNLKINRTPLAQMAKRSPITGKISKKSLDSAFLQKIATVTNNHTMLSRFVSLIS